MTDKAKAPFQVVAEGPHFKIIGPRGDFRDRFQTQDVGEYVAGELNSAYDLGLEAGRKEEKMDLGQGIKSAEVDNRRPIGEYMLMSDEAKGHSHKVREDVHVFTDVFTMDCQLCVNEVAFFAQKELLRRREVTIDALKAAGDKMATVLDNIHYCFQNIWGLDRGKFEAKFMPEMKEALSDWQKARGE